MEPMSFSICPDCGFAHPPVPAGSRCPLAKEKTASGEEINLEVIFTPLRNILISQIKKKDIKDQKKLFGKIILEVTKIVEDYKEVKP
jgi:hypothetical protein